MSPLRGSWGLRHRSFQGSRPWLNAGGPPGLRVLVDVKDDWSGASISTLRGSWNLGWAQFYNDLHSGIPNVPFSSSAVVLTFAHLTKQVRASLGGC